MKIKDLEMLCKLPLENCSGKIFLLRDTKINKYYMTLGDWDGVSFWEVDESIADSLINIDATENKHFKLNCADHMDDVIKLYKTTKMENN